MDTYEIYRQWFRDHYGREFTCTREEWREWCRAPYRAHAPQDFDIETEQREGWSYGSQS